MSSAQGQRAYTPAACPNSTQSVRTGWHGRTHVHQRTVAEAGQAPPKTRFLAVLPRPRRMVSSGGARSLPDLGLRARFEHTTNVNLRHEGMLDEFVAPHLAKKNSRCRSHQRRPEMMMRPTSARLFSRQPAEQLRGALKWRSRSGTPTACPIERTTPTPSGAALEWRSYSPGCHLY